MFGDCISLPAIEQDVLSVIYTRSFSFLTKPMSNLRGWQISTSLSIPNINIYLNKQHSEVLGEIKSNADIEHFVCTIIRYLTTQ